MTDDIEYTKCPFCSENILKDAKKCKHCGEMLDPLLRQTSNNGATNTQTVIVSTPTIKHRFPHAAHLFGCLLTGFLWTPIYILHYCLRDKKYYD